MSKIEYIKFLIEHANRGLHEQTLHDEEAGQLHVTTRDAIREKMILEMIEKRRINGKDAEDILPSIMRY